MGSFNVTCSVTDLPITWDEKVKVGFLVESPQYDMIRTCSRYRFMFPFLLDGVYDDYGQCKVEVSDEARHQMDEFIKKNAIIQKNDENIVNTSLKLTRENLNLDTIYNYLHEGVLYFKQGDTYIARENLEFQDIYSKPISYDHPVQVFPFTIKKDVYDRILSGSYDPNCPTFDNGKLTYENITFDDFKKQTFGDPNETTLSSFFVYLMDRMKNSEELFDPSLFKDDVENKDELVKELDTILKDVPRSSYMIITMSFESGGGEKAIRKSIDHVYTSAKKGDKLDGIENLLNLVEFFDKNKHTMDTSEAHRKVVYEHINKVSMHDSGARTCFYMHFYRDFFVESDIPIDEFKNFYSFMLWYDNYINGTVKPSRYAGQDYNTRAYKLFFNSCLESIERHENYDGEDEDDEDYEDDEE